MALLEKLIATIAPHECLICGLEGQLLCKRCARQSLQQLPPRCYRCRATSDMSQTCQKCQRVSKLKHVWVGSDYQGVAEALVKRLKFNRTQTAAVIMAEHLVEALPTLNHKNYLVTHIPTATSRVRERGYDQAKLLARELAVRLDLEFATILARHGQARQVGAKREARLGQLRGSFEVIKPQVVSGRKIVLVDDVLTTGATMELAAAALKKAGVKQVDGVVFAQA